MATGTISTYESGKDLVVEWKIDDFLTFLKRVAVQVVYCSGTFSFGGETWYLGIYPTSRRGTYGHWDLRLYKYYSGRSIKQAFSLSLKTVDEENCNEQHCMKDFQKGWDYHTFTRFILRSELTRRRSELVPDGVLTVVCTMKSSTSAASDEMEVSTAEVNKSDVSNVAGSSESEASGSSQAGTTTTKKSVLKWITENCKVPSKGNKIKTEKENVLKWIEQNCNETLYRKKRKMEEKNDEACTSGSSASPHDKKIAQKPKELYLQKEIVMPSSKSKVRKSRHTDLS